MRHRPIGIGVQGLADTFMMLKIPFESKEAEILNSRIFEVIYYGAIEKSVELAKKYGPYSTFQGSPFSHGKFQFDLCKEFNKKSFVDSTQNNTDLNWENLRQNVMKHGTRNSLLTSVMPTASTSQILGNYECVEMPTSNIYKRRTLAGEFPVVNKHLIKDLINLNLWDANVQYQIVKDGGSIQNISCIPQNIKELYKTMWEVKQKAVINLSAQRSLYIDQSQSLNLFFEDPNFNVLYSAHFYGWNMGLKTGSYYIRSKSAVNSDDITHVYKESKLSKEAEIGDDTESTCESCAA
jgi:ribonucleoside-diphosphate reductase alpha chain